MINDKPLCQRPGNDPDDWFAPAGSARELTARMRCVSCPLMLSCREDALRLGIPYGTWGGLDSRTRERLWRRTPGGRPQLFDQGIQRMHELYQPAEITTTEGVA